MAGVNNNRIQSGLGSEYAKQWELAIRQALMPVQVSTSGTVTTVLPEVPGERQAAPDTRAVKGETTPSHGKYVIVEGGWVQKRIGEKMLFSYFGTER